MQISPSRARAGVKTLKLEEHSTQIFSIDEMLPAVGQGIIAAQCRKKDSLINNLLEKIDHKTTRQCATAERSLLKILWPREKSFTHKIKGNKDDGKSIGKLIGNKLLTLAGNNFIKTKWIF